MKRLFLLLAGVWTLHAHDVITTAMTFDREIVRIMIERCASCHRQGGSSFPMLTYAETRPWAVAIKEEVLRRRMPPWGAVKGFGEFRNDQGLSAEELEVLLSWIDGGVPEGDEKNLPKIPEFSAAHTPALSKGAVTIGPDYKLLRAWTLDGMQPKTIPARANIKLTAELPSGAVEPMLWLDSYRADFAHPFLFRKPLVLPAGTVIRGLPAGATVMLLPTATPRP